MELFGGILAVNYGELTNSVDGDAVISVANYKALCRRNAIIVLRPGKGLGHPALIEWATMPSRFKERFVAKYGDPEQELKKSMNTLKIDESARRFYASYILENGEHLKEEQIKEYTLNASVLGRLVANYNAQKASRGLTSNNTPVNWTGLMSECERLRDEFAHTLPRNEARLREKMRTFMTEGYECLVSRKMGNRNTCKLTEEAQEWVIAQMRNRVHRNRVVDVFNEYNRIASERGWKTIRSQQTLLNFLDRPDIRPLWEDAKIGELAVRAKIQRQGSFAPVSKRDALWFGDGTVINLYYKEYVGGKYVVRRLWTYEVADAATECLIGYDIAMNESFDMMYNATMMALSFAGHKPYSYGYDNQTGSKQAFAERFLAKVANVSYHTAPYHGNSKTIESIFGRFQKQVLSREFNYSGGNITACSLASKIDREFLEANVANLPTKQEAIAKYLEARSQWNAMPMAGDKACKMSRLEAYQNGVNENTTPLTDDMLTDIRMLFTAKAVKYSAAGMVFTVKGVEYKYEVMNEELTHGDSRFTTEHVGMEFFVEYDPDTLGLDGSYIRLYRDFGKAGGLQFVTKAYRKIMIPRDMMSQTPEQKAWLQEEIRLNKKERVRVDMRRKEIEIAHGVSPEQQGFKSPGLHGVGGREYERFADEISRDDTKAKAGSKPGETIDDLPIEIGAVEKAISGADRMSEYLSRL